MKRFALAGNPNCGKTTLFNSLTGSTAYVGNWPGVTVDKKEGTYKKLEEPISIIDLPGIYSLSPYSPEEVISRNYILDEKPDCVINIVDGTNLERNLYLTTQLLEMDVPMILAINMADLIAKNNQSIDTNKLSKILDIPVVEISALKESNLEDLMKKAYETSKHPRKGKTILKGCKLDSLINKVNNEYLSEEISNPLFHAIKLIENDEIEIQLHKNILPLVTESKKDFNDEIFGSDFEAIIADERYKFLSKNIANIIVKNDGSNQDPNQLKTTLSDKIDKVLTNRIWGIPIFIAVLFVIFHLTFATNFLYLKNIFPLNEDGEIINVTLQGTPWEGLIVSADGVASPGVFLQTCLVGFTDWITDLTKTGLESVQGDQVWVSGLICDGILAGIFSVLSFLPQICLLFLFFAILEDTGYMARIAFILDRIFRRFGLSGRAFMPMIMGFGCSIPAMINTRTLADDNERTTTIRVIPFFACGAKLPVLTAVAGQIAIMCNINNPDLFTLACFLVGIVTALITVIIMKATVNRGAVPPFVMELPSYHLPQLKALGIHVWDKIKHFVKKAFTIILASNILIWFISHVNLSWNAFLPDEEISNSIAATIGKLLQPIFTPLGFGSNLAGEFGWIFVVATICGLIAKENVLSIFSALSAAIAGGTMDDYTTSQAMEMMVDATNITTYALFAFAIFNLLTIPCFAAVATAKAELPKNKFKGTILFWLVTSFFVGSMFYLIPTYWWTCFIYLAIIGSGIGGIIYYNKYQDKKNNTLKGTD